MCCESAPFLPRSSARLPLPSGTIDLSGDRNYARYHHVLNRAARSPLRASSERNYQRRHRPYKRLADWARQMPLQLRRWPPPAGAGGRRQLSHPGPAPFLPVPEGTGHSY